MIANKIIKIDGCFFIIALALVSPLTYAEKCKNSGSLAYLGNTDDGSHSIWLSKNLENSAQNFELQSAGNNPFFFDNFAIGANGLHTSASTNVSNGSGGTHKLFDASGDDLCLMDTQNQKNGIVFPSFPPDGLIPLTPTVPGAVTPPIGTLPPTGLTPTVPGAVIPPIGTLPPTGLTPTVPGAVIPPIGTLPPTGLTPTVPGAVIPPIGTLPPTGLTPTVPGAVIPPIGTLPPTGLTPTVPGTVTPPIGTLPPSTGGNTGSGGTGGNVDRPSGKNIVNGIIAATTQGGTGSLVMRDYTISNRIVNGLFGRQRITATNRLAINGSLTSSRRITTSGQQSDDSPQWNAWANAHFYDIKDQRYKLNTSGTLQQAYAGVDSLVTPNLVLGLAGAYEGSDQDGYRNYVSTNTDAYVIGPYIGYQVQPNIVLDGWLGYARQNVDTRIATAKGDYSVNQFFASLNATAQFDLGFIGVQPKLSFYYSVADSQDLKLKVRNLSGRSIGTLTVPINNQDIGLLDQSLEFNHTFTPAQDILLMPYVRAGGRYAFQQPNDGKILSGDFTLVTSSPWSGNMRGGLRTLVSDKMVIDVSGGYLSLGQKGLDIWEGKVAFQWLF